MALTIVMCSFPETVPYCRWFFGMAMGVFALGSLCVDEVEEEEGDDDFVHGSRFVRIVCYIFPVVPYYDEDGVMRISHDQAKEIMEYLDEQDKHHHGETGASG